VLTIDDADWHDPLAQQLIDEVQQEYVARYGGPDETAVDGAEFAAPYGAFVIARAHGEAVGCGGLRRHDPSVVEIKRMFVRAAHRRRGHARALLRALEDRARRSGYSRVVLETGMAQPEAIALYESEGYRPIAGFGHYAGEPLSRSFGKDL
jgi:GNAT superfamily N-acetyltransferase